MATQEVIVDQKPVDLAPLDPSVIIPEHVKRAAAKAESYYAKPEAPVEEAPAPEVEAPPLAPVEAAPAPEAPVVQQPAPPMQDYTAPATKEELHNNDWAARYNSMRGRWEAAQRTIGSMQEQMTQMGDELMRAHNLLRQQPAQEQQQPVRNGKLITPDDEAAYGTDLIDLARRAALETVGPELEHLKQENNNLKQQVTRTAQDDLRSALSRDIPNWQAINKSAEFKNWLRLPNVYTGMVRQQMLNDAYNAADAPKVAAFFKDFLREGVATGQLAPAQQVEPPLVPREPAVQLERIAAPGRAKPASGESPASPADKPIITRNQIAAFYSDVRAQRYAGRETEKARLENMIYEAQREGRVR